MADDGIVPDRNFIDASAGSWVEASTLGVTGDWIIRAVIDAMPLASETLLANDGWVSGEVAAFQAGFVAGEAAAVRLVPVGPCPCPVDKVRFLNPVNSGKRVRAHSVISKIELKGAAVNSTRTITVEIEGVEKRGLMAEWIGRIVFGS